MAVLTWDGTGERFFETGVDRGVLYPMVAGAYPQGYAWNGLTAVTESPSGAEATPIYADNRKYLNLLSAEEFAATIEAFTYPTEFEACDGTAEAKTGVFVGQQTRQAFGFSYRTLVGNDVDGNDHAYKIHVVYNALAAPSEKARNTVNDTPEAAPFSWEITTTPVDATGLKPTAHIVFDTRTMVQTDIDAIEDQLYGTGATESALLLPDALLALVTTP